MPLSTANDWFGVGDGWQFADQFPGFKECVTVIEEATYPQARDIAVLAADALQRGLQVPAEQALPVYLRGKSAWRRINEQ